MPLTPQQQQQQQMYLANQQRVAQGGINMVGLTPQQQAQYSQHLLQQQQQQQQMRPGMMMPNGMRPGMSQYSQQQQQFMYTGNTSMAVGGVGIQDQQQHPALIQQQQNAAALAAMKRKNKSANDVSAMAVAVEDGDELDHLQPYNVSLARYQNNHNLMSEIFIALPTSTINVPNHYYEELKKDDLDGELTKLGESIESCEKDHKERLQKGQQEKREFAEMIKTLVDAKYEDIDKIKTKFEHKFEMEFVNDPYSTVVQVPISKIEAAEGAVYKQL